jgi:hypothetical protein
MVYTNYKTARFVAFAESAQSIIHKFRSSPRPISTGPLKALLPLHSRPINQIFSLGSYHVDRVGEFILKEASRLDAFSAYPVQT